MSQVTQIRVVTKDGVFYPQSVDEAREIKKEKGGVIYQRVTRRKKM